MNFKKCIQYNVIKIQRIKMMQRETSQVINSIILYIKIYAGELY